LNMVMTTKAIEGVVKKKLKRYISGRMDKPYCKNNRATLAIRGPTYASTLNLPAAMIIPRGRRQVTPGRK